MESVWVVQQEWNEGTNEPWTAIEIYGKYEDARKTYEGWVSDAKSDFADSNGYDNEDLGILERDDFCELEVGGYDSYCTFKIYEEIVR